MRTSVTSVVSGFAVSALRTIAVTNSLGEARDKIRDTEGPAKLISFPAVGVCKQEYLQRDKRERGIGMKSAH